MSRSATRITRSEVAPHRQHSLKLRKKWASTASACLPPCRRSHGTISTKMDTSTGHLDRDGLGGLDAHSCENAIGHARAQVEGIDRLECRRESSSLCSSPWLVAVVGSLARADLGERQEGAAGEVQDAAPLRPRTTIGAMLEVDEGDVESSCKSLEPRTPPHIRVPGVFHCPADAFLNEFLGNLGGRLVQLVRGFESW